MEWLLPLLILLACPLMHFWMMRGHGDKEGKIKHKKKRGCCH